MQGNNRSTTNRSNGVCWSTCMLLRRMDVYRVAREEMFVVGQRPDVADILIIITDGMYDDPNATWVEAMDTRASNISIIAVSVYKYFENRRVAKAPLVTMKRPKFTPKTAFPPRRSPPHLIHPSLDRSHSAVLPQYTLRSHRWSRRMFRKHEPLMLARLQRRGQKAM